MRILNTLRESMARTGLRMPGLATTLPTITVPGTSASSIATGTLYTPMANANRFTFLGGAWELGGPVYPNNQTWKPVTCHAGNGSDITANPSQGSAARVRFSCWAPKLEIFVAYGDASGGFRLKVNGEYVATGLLGNSADGTANGSLRYIPVQWGDGTETYRAQRFYELEFSSNGKFGGVRCGNLHAPQPWAQADGLRVLMHGDSMVNTIVDSTNHATQLNLTSLGSVLGQVLGQADCWVSSVGSTGWLAPVANNYSKFNDRVVLDVVTPAPDVIFELGGKNDQTPFTTEAAYQALVNIWLDTVLAAKPETIVFMTGPVSSLAAENTNASQMAIRNAKAAAAARYPKNVAFIDNIAAVWATGSGKQSAPNGSGNSDWVIGSDATHPTIEGNRYIAALLAAAAAKAIPTLIAAQ